MPFGQPIRRDGGAGGPNTQPHPVRQLHLGQAGPGGRRRRFGGRRHLRRRHRGHRHRRPVRDPRRRRRLRPDLHGGKARHRRQQHLLAPSPLRVGSRRSNWDTASCQAAFIGCRHRCCATMAGPCRSCGGGCRWPWNCSWRRWRGWQPAMGSIGAATPRTLADGGARPAGWGRRGCCGRVQALDDAVTANGAGEEPPSTAGGWMLFRMGQSRRRQVAAAPGV